MTMPFGRTEFGKASGPLRFSEQSQILIGSLSNLSRRQMKHEVWERLPLRGSTLLSAAVDMS